MRRTRWSFVRVPQLLREILQQSIAAQPDMEVAPEVSAVAEGRTLPAVDPDQVGVVVLVQRREGLPAAYDSLLHRVPRLRIVVLSRDGRRAAVYRLLLQETVCEDVSPGELLAAVRASAGVDE